MKEENKFFVNALEMRVSNKLAECYKLGMSFPDNLSEILWKVSNKHSKSR